jgi:hypothetical protein
VIIIKTHTNDYAKTLKERMCQHVDSVEEYKRCSLILAVFEDVMVDLTSKRDQTVKKPR